ncbi:MAG TPA: GNAT family N-acetyltransferase [Stellaceae bacterium]|nr:GNAT family N-acetyltransferase [Stellaceae bacterium]
MSIVIEQITEPTPEFAALIRELDGVLGANYEPHQRHGLALAQLFEPHMRFFIVRLDGSAVGCGGVALFDAYAEVKRMYTRPEARGRGLATALLQRIEAEARAAGKPMLRLETGPLQHKAIGLYRRMGFTGCGAFGAYAVMNPRQIEMSLFFEKRLD